MAHINLASATNSKFPNIAPNDVQIYSTTSTPTFFIGASNAPNYVQISPSMTSTSNLNVTGQSTSSNATISNLVITGAIWSSNADGLQQYAVGGGGSGGSVSSNLTVKTITSTSATTNLLTVNGELVINAGAPQSNVTMSNATFSNMSADYITAFTNLTVSSGGTVTLPSGSIIGTTLDPKSSSVLSNIVLSNLTVSNIVNFASNAITWSAINSNSVSVPWSKLTGVPALGVQDSSQLTYINNTIPTSALIDVPNSISWTSLDPTTFSEINYVSASGGGGAPTEIPNMTIEGGDFIISNKPYDGASTGTYLSNSIPWTALNSNTFSEINYVSASGGGAPTQIPNMTIEGGDLLITNAPYDGSSTSTFLSNSIPFSAINSNTSPSNLSVLNTFTTSNLVVTGTVTGIVSVGSNITTSNIWTSNIYTSNVTLSNLTIGTSVAFPTNFSINTGTGTVTATSFSGSVAVGNVTGNLPVLQGGTGVTTGLTQLNAGNINSGILGVGYGGTGTTGASTGTGGVVLNSGPTINNTTLTGTLTLPVNSVPDAAIAGINASKVSGNINGNAASLSTALATSLGGTGVTTGLTQLNADNVNGGLLGVGYGGTGVTAKIGTGLNVLNSNAIFSAASNIGTFSNSGEIRAASITSTGALTTGTGLTVGSTQIISNTGAISAVPSVTSTGNISVTGTGKFSGDGSLLTSLDGTKLTGSIPASLSVTYTTFNRNHLQNESATATMNNSTCYINLPTKGGSVFLIYCIQGGVGSSTWILNKDGQFGSGAYGLFRLADNGSPYGGPTLSLYSSTQLNVQGSSLGGRTDGVTIIYIPLV